MLSQESNSKTVLKELGVHEGNNIIIKNGRYGIYVTNGKVNVTLPKGSDYNDIPLEKAINMIKNKKTKGKKI